MDPTLDARLSAIEARLDEILDRSERLDALIADLGPIGREVVRAATVQLDGLERRGWFRVGREFYDATDTVVGDLRPDELHDLLASAVAVLRTLRNVTRPDVLRVVNEAADVVHGAREIPAVGPLGLLGAGRDEDVQRGLGLLIEITRHLGRASRTMDAPPPAPAVPGTQSSGRFRRSAPRSPDPAPEPAPRAGPAPVAADPPFEPDWTMAIAERRAEALGFPLTDDHRAVIAAARADHATTSASPNVRRLGQVCGLTTRELYNLFPQAPGRTVARLAGLPKPTGCI